MKRNHRRFYKGRYFIVFYDKTDEELRYMFDNVIEILKFQRKPITKENIRRVNVNLYRELKTEERFSTFLTGEVLRVYLVEIN